MIKDSKLLIDQIQLEEETEKVNLFNLILFYIIIIINYIIKRINIY